MLHSPHPLLSSSPWTSSSSLRLQSCCRVHAILEHLAGIPGFASRIIRMSLSSNLIEAHERKPIIHPYTPQHPSRLPHPSSYMQIDPANGSYMTDPNNSSFFSQNGFPPSSASFPRFSQWSEEKVATLQARLARKLGPEYVTQRPGPAGGPRLRLACQYLARRS